MKHDPNDFLLSNGSSVFILDREKQGIGKLVFSRAEKPTMELNRGQHLISQMRLFKSGWILMKTGKQITDCGENL